MKVDTLQRTFFGCGNTNGGLPLPHIIVTFKTIIFSATPMPGTMFAFIAPMRCMFLIVWLGE
ncbi:MAG: hypothetical protein HBSAPP01_05550 [Candidatus Brocadia sapporoensis]|nr:MAG: hypothetical protein HBSAPP01_05550 [Candidatus Brocadia sapporoensis]